MKPEKQVHVVYSLSRSALEQIVDYRDDEQFAIDFLEVEKTLVGVHHIFQVGHSVDYKCEIVVGIILVVEATYLVELHRAVEICRHEDAARETAAHRDKFYLAVETVLQLLERLLDFGKVLVAERLVD